MQRAGLALSIGLASCINARHALPAACASGGISAPAGLGLFFIKLLAALAVLGVAVWFAVGSDSLWLQASGVDAGPPDAAGGRQDGDYSPTLFALGFRVRFAAGPPAL